MNNVKDICSIIKEAKLDPSEVNIICSDRADNEEKLRALSKKGQGKFKIGSIPKRGEPHKMFTFCTSTVYVGADFYSTCAYTYIFANPRIKSMTIDVSIDLQQIIGRQRLEENPFRNSATLYYDTEFSKETEADLEAMVADKTEKARQTIVNFEAAPYKDNQVEVLVKAVNSAAKKGEVMDRYICITQDEKGKPSVVINQLVEVSDRRAWELSNQIYNSDFSMFKTLKVGLNVTRTIDSQNGEVQKTFDLWNNAQSFPKKMELYCDLYEKSPDLIGECYFIPKKYRDYYDALGREGLETKSWKECYIKSEIAPITYKNLKKNEIARQLKNEISMKKSYSKVEIKKIFQEIYNKMSLSLPIPPATEILNYLDCSETSTRKDNKKIAGFTMNSIFRKNISLFKRITDVKNPENYTIDSVLNIIKTSSYFKLKERIGDLRRSRSKQEKDKIKSSLPVVTWNGTFKTKNRNEVLLYSSFTALDFDHVKDMKKFAEWLKTYDCVYSYFVSPSGEGYKAIILHDNYEPLYHGDLYKQLVKLFDCPEIDSSTLDLARGNYLSYDPNLWINPDPKEFHFIPTTEAPQPEVTRTETVIRNESGEDIVVKDRLDIADFLLQLSLHVISDDSIIRILRRSWTGEAIGEGRNNASMSYLGVLCKAGVDKEKSRNLVKSLIPGFDISEIIEYAYTNNIFGCERRKYKSKK